MKRILILVFLTVIALAMALPALANVAEGSDDFYFRLTRTPKVDSGSACTKTSTSRRFYVTVLRQTPRGSSNLVGGDVPVFRSFFGTSVSNAYYVSNPAYPPRYDVAASATYFSGEGGVWGNYWLGGGVSNQSSNTSFRCTGTWTP